jgi:conjugative transfer signal peptidase TraF
MRVRTVYIITTAAFACLIAIATPALFGRRLWVNPSISAPRGVYWLTPAQRVDVGDFVLVCVPAAAERLGVQRGYLQPGKCPGGAAPEMKHVAAIAGDVVAIGASGVSVDGRVLPHSRTLARDTDGRVLTRWNAPTHRLRGNEIWLYSDVALGYDSRYFGPAPARAVLGALHPLFTESTK